MLRAAALIMLALVLLGSAPAAAEPPLVLATESNYPPFASLDANGNLTGFDIDIARALCAAMDRECEIVDVNWNDLITGLEQGRFDAIVASMAKTPERERRVDYTDRYYSSTSAFVGDPAAVHGATPETLRGRTAAVVTDTVQARYVTENFSGVLAIRYVPTLQEAFDLLEGGGVDVVFAGRFPSLTFLQSAQGRRFDFIGDPITDTEYISDAFILVRKGDEELRNAFNQAIRAIRRDGTYTTINLEYFPFDIY